MCDNEVNSKTAVYTAAAAAAAVQDNVIETSTVAQRASGIDNTGYVTINMAHPTMHNSQDCHENDSNTSVWTGFYKQINGNSTSNGTGSSTFAVTANSATFHGPPTRHARPTMVHSGVDSNLPVMMVNGAVVVGHSNNATTSSFGTRISCPDTTCTFYSNDTLVHATHVTRDKSTQFTRCGFWMVSSSVLLLSALVAIAVSVALVATRFQAPGIAVPNIPLTDADHRAAELTEYINGVKLSTGTLAVPLPMAVSASSDSIALSAEQAALSWLVHDDPLHLSPANKSQLFQLRQRYALLTLLLQFERNVTMPSILNDNECHWPIVAECLLEPSGRRQLTGSSSSSSSANHVTKLVSHGVIVQSGSTLSPDLGLLSHLQILSLASSGLEGSLPSSLGTTWSNLHIFDLSNNALTGSLPASLGMAWNNLESFTVNRNALTGSLPSLLGTTWTNLQSMDVAHNALMGSLSPILGAAWTNLETFDVSHNTLTGSLPLLLGSEWINLQFFYVSSNVLTGSLPLSLGTARAARLQSYSVSGNNLRGRIPQMASQWNSIEKAYFDRNNFVGSMPGEFCPDTSGTLTDLFADCEEVACPCCTSCCNDDAATCESFV